MVNGLKVEVPSIVIEERAAAIKYAVDQAQSGDTVLVLGKGHEVGQEISGAILPFDDRLQLAEAIEGKQ